MSAAMRYFVFVFALMMGPLPAADPVSVTRAELQEYGVFKEEVTGKTDNPTTVSGYINRTSSQKLVTSTDQIEGKLQVSFGITYVVEGRPKDGEIELSIKLSHPPMTNPATGETSTVEENPAESTIGGPNYDGFTFEQPWEIVPGKWTFEVYHEGRLLLEKSFTVTKP